MKKGVYQHYQGGTYTVLMTARCSDNGPNEGRKVVVYVSHTTGEVCTRFADEFCEKVDGRNRFTFVAKCLSRGEKKGL